MIYYYSLIALLLVACIPLIREELRTRKILREMREEKKRHRKAIKSIWNE